MEKTIVRPGSTVTVNYIGTLENGRIFHSTDDDTPLTFILGAGQIFPALEEAVMGMRSGEVKNIVLSAEQAYGPRRKENIITVARHLFPAEREIMIGQKLGIEFKGGGTRMMIVTSVDESGVTLDGNHPLAGEELTFALRVVNVE